MTARFCWASFFLSWLSHYTTHFPFPTPEFLRSFHYTNNATRSLSIYNSPHICLCSDFKGFQADVSYYPSGTFFQGKKKTVFVLHCANQLLELFCTGVFYLVFIWKNSYHSSQVQLSSQHPSGLLVVCHNNSEVVLVNISQPS